MSPVDETLESGVARWLSALEESLVAKDFDCLRGLFLEDSHWRDMAAFTWTLGSVSGIDEIESLFAKTVDEIGPHHLRVSNRHTRPRSVARSGRDVVEVHFLFDTALGYGTGVVRLVPAADVSSGLKAWILLTRLDGFNDFPVPTSRPEALGYDRTDTRENWLDRRDARRAFEDRDPEVLIVGGGHQGLMAAVHLLRLGVDTLVVDRFPRIGDNWRTRYHSLALHNKTDMLHFPFMPFPDAYPEYLPKDKFANWFEAYVEAMEINYWTSTEFISASFDETTQLWSATVRRSDNSERTMHPRHIIIATGNTGGTPNIPDLPGIDSFSGEVIHTKYFRSGAELAGKKVLIVGVGTSSHDVAYDLCNHGASVTMMQRNATTVVNLDSANLSYPQFEDGTPLEEADLISAAGFIPAIREESFRRLTTITTERDRPLLDRLEAAGMRLDYGEDGTGWMMKFFVKGGGYYINVGTSELVADGTIGLIQASDLDTFVPEGVRFTDGRVEKFDAVILATGYLNQQVDVKRFFGDEVAERIGSMSGFDEVGELRNSWKPTAVQGLWFMVSGIASARLYTPPMTLLIKADLEGLLPVRRVELGTASMKESRALRLGGC